MASHRFFFSLHSVGFAASAWSNRLMAFSYWTCAPSRSPRLDIWGLPRMSPSLA